MVTSLSECDHCHCSGDKTVWLSVGKINWCLFPKYIFDCLLFIARLQSESWETLLHFYTVTIVLSELRDLTENKWSAGVGPAKGQKGTVNLPSLLHTIMLNICSCL